jgi:hypothetical protein
MRGKGGGRQKQESTDSLSEDSTETTYGTICRVIDVEESRSTDPHLTSPPERERERERERESTSMHPQGQKAGRKVEGSTYPIDAGQCTEREREREREREFTTNVMTMITHCWETLTEMLTQPACSALPSNLAGSWHNKYY